MTIKKPSLAQNRRLLFNATVNATVNSHVNFKSNDSLWLRWLLVLWLQLWFLPVANAIEWSTETHQPHFADFNGDGQADVLLQAVDPAHNNYLTITGQGEQPIVGDWQTAQLAVADFSGDGMAEIFAYWPAQHQATLAGQTFTANELPWLGLDQPLSLYTGDFNADGSADLLVVTDHQHYLMHSLLDTDNEGEAVIRLRLVQTLNPSTKWGHHKTEQLIIKDFNDDGHDDVFALAKQRHQHHYLSLSDGEGRLGKATKVPAQMANADWDAESFSVLAANVNGDAEGELVRLPNAAGGIDEDGNDTREVSQPIAPNKIPMGHAQNLVAPQANATGSCGYLTYTVTQGVAGDTCSLAAAPATPSNYPGTYGSSYKAVNNSYAVTLTAVAGATYYQIYTATSDGTEPSNYTLVYSGSNTVNYQVSRNVGYVWYKYKACSSSCSGFSPWRRFYVYGTPGNPNNVSLSPVNININVNYSLTWTPAGGSVDGTTYTVYEAYNGSESPVYSVTRQHWSESQYSYSTAKSAGGDYRYRVQACSPSVGCGPSVVQYQTIIAPNVAPTVTPTSPSNNASFTTGNEIIAAANASDSDGSIMSVDFKLDNGYWQSDSSAPYSVNLGRTTAGSHVIYYRSRDNNGVYSGQSTRVINVTPRNDFIALTLTKDQTLKGELSLGWNGVTGSSYYQLQRNILPLSSLYQQTSIITMAQQKQAEQNAIATSNADAWTDVVHASQLSYDELGAAEGIYYYRVRACFGPNDCGAYSQQLRVIIDKVEGLADFLSLSTNVTPGPMPMEAKVGGSGDALVTIPIALPPGIHNMQPDLTVEYNSGRISRLQDNPTYTGYEQVNHGDYLGLGWRFAGLSQIELCQTDNTSSSADIYFSGDFWCLDGEKLIKIADANASHGTLYKTRLDQQIKIERFGVVGSYQTWFKVTLPNGTVREYGRSAESQVPILSDRIYPSNKFAINKATDVWGNTIDYRYTANAAQNQLYPYHITYGSHGNSTHDTKISFSYARREDIEDITAIELEFGSNKVILTGIITEQKNSAGTYTPISKTVFYSEYPGNQATAHRELAAIQHCGYDNGSGESCYVPIQVDWTHLGTDNLPRYISRVTDSLGATTEFTVTTLHNDQATGRFSERPFGEPSLPANTTYSAVGEKTPNLVTRMTKSNGIGGTSSVDYAYQGNAVRSTIKLGTLGFFAQRITDNQTGFVSYVKKRVDLPFIGQVAETRTYTSRFTGGNDTLVSQTENRHVAQTLNQANGAVTYYPYLASTSQFNYEAGELLSVSQIKNSHTFVNNLLSGSSQTSQIAQSAVSGSLGSIWGERTTATLTSVKKTTIKTTTFTQRTSGDQWLINFVNNETTRHYAGTGTGAADSVQTIDNTPYQNTNEVATTTLFKGDPNLARTTTFGYNAYGLTHSETITGAHIASRTNRIDAFERNRFPASLVNALGQISHLAYDQRFGSIRRSTDANQLTTTVTPDNLGRAIRTTNSYGATSTTEYAFCQNVVCPTVYGVSPVYRVTTTSNNAPTQWQYLDQLNRTVRVAHQGFNGSSTINQDTLFDARGRKAKQSKPYFSTDTTVPATTFSYDNQNRIISESYPDGSRLATDYGIHYPPQGKQLRVTVTRQVLAHDGRRLENQIKVIRYNTLGEIASRTDASGGADEVITEYTYRADGLPASIHVANQANIYFGYDNGGNRLLLNDPNVGIIRNSYNALNLVRTQTDNSNNVTYYDYDLLNRQVSQRYADGSTSQWHFDSDPASNANTYGALFSRSFTDAGQSSPSFEQRNHYNALAQLNQIDTTIRVASSTKQYSQSLTYDDKGRPLTTSWPSGIVSKNNYNSAKYLSSVVNNATNAILQTINAMDALGNITSQSYGNGLITNRVYDPLTSRINTITTSNGIQDLSYRWRSNGLLERRDQGVDRQGNSQNLYEDFSYDPLNRLTQAITLSNGNPIRHQQTGYTNIGNISYKTSDVATDKKITQYQYGDDLINGQYGAGLNAVVAANINGTSQNIEYDNNGNIRYYSATDANDSRYIQWNSRNLPVVITKGSSATTATPTARESFQYGPDGQRFYKQSSYLDDNGVLQTEHTFYVGGIEEVVAAVESEYALITKASISEGVMHISTIDKNNHHQTSVEYLHKDYLGSVEVVTNQAAVAINSFAYDPYGERKQVDWSASLTDDELSRFTAQNLKRHRGFTGHEHLDRTGLIHMNGRIYDPVLARFLSPDPLVSDPYFSQSYNRYSYVLNNPLGFTDPSGYSPSCTDSKHCVESSIELLPGPGNYIITFGSGHQASSTESGATESTAAEGSIDEQGELSNDRDVGDQDAGIDLSGFNDKVDITQPPNLIKLPEGINYKDLSKEQKVAMHITNNTMQNVFKKIIASTDLMAKQVNIKNINPVWYPDPKGNGAWQGLEKAFAMGSHRSGENIQFNGQEMLQLLPGGKGISGGMAMLIDGYVAVGYDGIPAGQVAFDYTVAHEIAHTVVTNSSKSTENEQRADGFYLHLFER